MLISRKPVQRRGTAEKCVVFSSPTGYAMHPVWLIFLSRAFKSFFIATVITIMSEYYNDSHMHR